MFTYKDLTLDVTSWQTYWKNKKILPNKLIIDII